ncbi:MAG: glucose-1-phosphate adenylyltransferase [candidate division WOR-3 bacterium]|nr:MAG: glucose-1-phosphate adenylyltransferase [candidate division WOR-3 bacterium]
MTKDVIALLLAGGVGSRLNILAGHRAKPAIPFAAIYRIIDFTLSNIALSDIDVVGVLTQYKPLSLMEHIDNGRPWDLSGRTRQVEILPPKTGEESSDWYKGTSDAVYQNLGFIETFSPDVILIVSGDHIYHMNYNEVIRFHREHKAAATVCLIEVPRQTAHHFGIAEVNAESVITRWIEKPQKPRSNLASMGIYIFDTGILSQSLRRVAAEKGTDFARNVIPHMIKTDRVCGYRFAGYWRDVGTIDAYWRANMDVFNERSGLDIASWSVKTNQSIRGEIGDRPPSYIGKTARISSSLFGRGCIIEGTVTHSVLSPGVRVGAGAVVANSIVFHDTVISEQVTIEKSIIDKEVRIESSTRIGQGTSTENKKFPDHLSSGITVIGKRARIVSRTTIGKNCIVFPEVTVTRNVRSGDTVC